jgi:hypothetical protein
MPLNSQFFPLLPGGDDQHDPSAGELFYEQIPQIGFVDYNGKPEVHNSLLNVILHDAPQIKTTDEAINAE